MKRSYSSPRVSEFGDIAKITGIFGAPFTGDVLVNETGQVVQEGNNSINACATGSFEECISGPN
jgi:hypothetical protein